MHIDLRHYLEIDDKPLTLEIKQGSFIREHGSPKDGKDYETVMDIPIS